MINYRFNLNLISFYIDFNPKLETKLRLMLKIWRVWFDVLIETRFMSIELSMQDVNQIYGDSPNLAKFEIVLDLTEIKIKNPNKKLYCIWECKPLIK